MKRWVLILFALALCGGAQAGEFTKDMQWSRLTDALARNGDSIRRVLLEAEEQYQLLLVARNGDSDADWCKRLRAKDPCTADEISQVSDAVSAGQAIHQLFQAFDGSADVTQSNRAADLRKFSN